MSTTKRNEMRNVMRLSWFFVRHNGLGMAEAMKLAWLNIKVKAAMQLRIVKFYFLKIDGSVREAYGTLKADLVPQTGDGDRRRNETVQAFFDSEKQAWRCFKKANLLRMA